MKSSDMLAHINTAHQQGYSLPDGLLRLYVRSGSLKVREQLFRLVARHSVVVARMDKEARFRFMLAFLEASFDASELFSFYENVRMFLAEIRNYQVDDPERHDLLQALLDVIDRVAVNETDERYLEVAVLEKLLRLYPELSDERLYHCSPKLQAIITSAWDYLIKHSLIRDSPIRRYPRRRTGTR